MELEYEIFSKWKGNEKKMIVCHPPSVSNGINRIQPITRVNPQG